MSIIVRITVQDNERIRAALNDQILPVLVARQPPTQETLRSGLGRGGRRLDVVRAPGSPDPIQHNAFTPEPASSTASNSYVLPCAVASWISVPSTTAIQSLDDIIAGASCRDCTWFFQVDGSHGSLRRRSGLVTAARADVTWSSAMRRSIMASRGLFRATNVFRKCSEQMAIPDGIEMSPGTADDPIRRHEHERTEVGGRWLPSSSGSTRIWLDGTLNRHVWGQAANRRGECSRRFLPIDPPAPPGPFDFLTRDRDDLAGALLARRRETHPDPLAFARFRAAIGPAVDQEPVPGPVGLETRPGDQRQDGQGRKIKHQCQGA